MEIINETNRLYKKLVEILPAPTTMLRACMASNQLRLLS